MNTTTQDWVYLKIYPGTKVGGMDGIVLDVIGDVLGAVKSPPWFFLRYLDDKGPHIRLRFAVPAAHLDDITDEASIRCEGLLDQLVSKPDSSYRGLIPLPEAPDGFPAGHFGVIREDYLPELEKFGGLEGMAIAERLFQHSSEVALLVLAAERNGKASRKTLAPWLMQVGVESLGAKLPREFWRRYSEYWLGGSKSAATAWREQFARKHQQLAAVGVSVLPPATTLTAVENEAVATWRTALGEARRRYDRCDGVGEEEKQQVFWNFIHLMNNRLGIGPLEEAYLATLLELREGDA